LPFWTQSSLAWSKKLWSCIETDCVVSPSTLWNPSLRALGQNSWFTVRKTVRKMTQMTQGNSPTICLPSPLSLWRAITDAVPQPTVKDDPVDPDKPPPRPTKPPPVGMHKVQCYPDIAHQQTIKKWIGAARWAYNQAVGYMNDPKTKGKRTIKDLRAHCVNDSAIKDKRRGHWARVIPYDVRDEGVRDAKKAIGSNMAKQRHRQKQGLPHSFKMSFRRKRLAHHESFVVHAKHWGQKGLYSDLFGTRGKALNPSETLPETLPFDCRLMRTRLNEYFLCIPRSAEMVEDDNQVPAEPVDGVVALDPGVRTFMTAYDPSGQVVEWGVGDTTRIHRLCHTLDDIYKRCDDVNHRKRYRLRRAALRIRRKIRRIVDDLHRKLIKWLCSNYRVIIIPTFETQQMVKRGHRRLNSKTAKAMCTWSHFRFRTNLSHKASSMAGVRVITTTEEYTSKTCGGCGTVNDKLGGKKRFTCKACAFCSDRDFNGARNILIRYLTVARV
jgi:putative transposase